MGGTALTLMAPIVGPVPVQHSAVVRAMVVAPDSETRAAWSAGLATGPGHVVIEEFTTVDDVRARLADRAAAHRPSVVVGPSRVDDAATVLTAGARGYLFATPAAFTGATAPPTGPLSPREVEVLQGLADGLTTGQLAGELGLSPLTIKSHLARITKRLEARNRVHAVLIALREGLIE